MSDQEDNQVDLQDIPAMTAEIVSAYVGHHSVAVTDLPGLINMVGKGLASLSQVEATKEEERSAPAVPIRRSVTPDYIICLEDGKKLKMLKRHLKTSYDMTPD